MSSTNPNAPVARRDYADDNKGLLSVRLLGVVILMVELGLLFAYGFAGYYVNEVGSWGGQGAFALGLIPSEFLYVGEGMFFYISTMIFTLIGFGCLYAAISRSTISGFFLSFFIVGYTTILSPPIQKIWFNIFTSDFKTGNFNNLENNGMRDMYHYMSTNDVQVSFYSMRISLLNAISQLVVFYGLYQRLNAAQIFLFSTLYNVAWNLNYYLNIQVASVQPDGAKRLMDDYAINQVFLFGSLFAVISSLFLKKPPREDLAIGKALPHQVVNNPQVNNNDLSLITSVIGTFLLFLTFMGITICFPIKSFVRTRYIWAEGYMNILFALCASVFTNMFISSLTKNRIGLREVQFGMIGGAIIAGPVAGTLDNIGAYMAMGTFSGIISSLYFAYLHPRLIRSRVSDVYGALFVFIIAFLGTFMVYPLVIVGMIRNEVRSNLLMNNILGDGDNAGWILSYFGISVGIAFLSGLIIGGILRAFQKEHNREFDDENIFNPLPGLYDD